MILCTRCGFTVPNTVPSTPCGCRAQRPEHTWVCVDAQEILPAAGVPAVWVYKFADQVGGRPHTERRVTKAGLFTVGERYSTREIVADVLAAMARGPVRSPTPKAGVA